MAVEQDLTAWIAPFDKRHTAGTLMVNSVKLHEKNIAAYLAE